MSTRSQKRGPNGQIDALRAPSARGRALMNARSTISFLGRVCRDFAVDEQLPECATLRQALEWHRVHFTYNPALSSCQRGAVMRSTQRLWVLVGLALVASHGVERTLVAQVLPNPYRLVDG